MSANLITSGHRVDIQPIHLLGIGLMIFSFLAAISIAVLDSDLSRSSPYLFLLPWLALLCVVLLIPNIILYKKGQFSWANPLTFSTWSFFLPGFIVGGLALSLGWSHPYFIDFIQDPETSLPWTVLLVSLGFAGMSVGYFLPLGPAVGRLISAPIGKFLAEKPSSLVVPGFTLLALGMLNSTLAILLGVYEYQDKPGLYEGIVLLSTMFWVEGTFLLWYVVFCQENAKRPLYVVIGLLTAIGLFGITFSGSRASLLSNLIVIVLAFILSGRSLKMKQMALVAFLFCIALVFGMVYGTSYRLVSIDNPNSGIYTYFDNVRETIDRIGSSDSTDVLAFGLGTLAERLDEVSSLAVVVSNYEQLAPYEEGYGLDDNIRKDLLTTFIPRFIWSDKPIASNVHMYGQLYFEYGDNSFAMTPIGDLLRNYGAIGVFLGMLFLGILLRCVHATLIENQMPSVLRATFYFMLLISVNYESFFGLIVANLVKIGVISVIGLLFVKIVAHRFGFKGAAL